MKQYWMRKLFCLCVSLLMLMALIPGGVAAETDSGLEDNYRDGPVEGNLIMTKDMDVSDFSFSFTEEKDAIGNEGAIGYLTLDFRLNGPSGVWTVLIGGWWDEIPSGDVLDDSMDKLVDRWKDSFDTALLEEAVLPTQLSLTRPVFNNDVGKTQYIRLIGLDKEINPIGFAVVKVELNVGARNNNTVRILSITPGTAERGQTVTFAVTVEYSLKSNEHGEVELGVNSESETSYRFIDWVDVDKGSGTVTLTGTAMIPLEWNPVIVATISSKPRDESWDVSYFVLMDANILPTATQYVPYQASVPAFLEGNESFTITAGNLPAGLSLSSNGVISGIPEELGVFNFTVMETHVGGMYSNVEHEYTLSVYSRMYADVESGNVPGYGFMETETDDGRVQDQVVTSAAELTDQMMHLQGAYSQFRNLYLDARRLIRDVEYTAEEGSTKITIYAETIGEEGGGTHTLAAEFETDDGETVYTVQNYTVAGIASTEVHVTVFGDTVIWTDAEPYIDTNNRTMTPFRVVGDALGLTIAWDSATREASFSNGAKTIWFPIGSTTARTSEGQTVEMDTSAVIVNGRTYAPVRYLAEYFGYGVGWERVTRTVAIQ